MRVAWLQQLQGLGRVPVLFKDKVLITIFDRHTKQSSFVVYKKEDGSFIWNKTLPAGGYMTPVIGEKTVFVPTRFTKIAGLDLETGEEKWTFDFATRIRTSPYQHEENIIVPTANKIYLIDEDGNVNLMKKFPDMFFYGEPKVKERYIYVLGNKSSSELAQQVIMCLDIETLEVIWEVSAGEGKVMTCDTAGLALNDFNVYITNRTGTIFCLDQLTGKINWKYETKTQNNRSKPIIFKGKIYTNSSEGIITCLCAETGKKIFAKQLDKEGMYSPIGCNEDSIIVHCGVFLYMLHNDTGEIITKLPVGHGPYTQPIVDSHCQKLYLAAGDPPDYFNLVCLDLKRKAPELVEVIRQDYQKGDKDTLRVEFKVNVRNSNVLVDTVILGGPEYYKPEMQEGSYLIEKDIPSYLRYGHYALPVTITTEDQIITDFLYLNLSSEKTELPSKYLIQDFETNYQDSPSFSGGATMKSLLGYWGKEVDIALIKDVAQHYKKINVDPHHKWRTGAVRMFHASSLPINEASGEPRVPGLNLFLKNDNNS